MGILNEKTQVQYTPGGNTFSKVVGCTVSEIAILTLHLNAESLQNKSGKAVMLMSDLGEQEVLITEMKNVSQHSMLYQ